MASAQSSCLEAARASALASHSAASLAAAAGFKQAARLLRSSEALARAAAAALAATKIPDGSSKSKGKGTGGGSRDGNVDVVMGGGDVGGGAAAAAGKSRRRRRRKRGTAAAVRVSASDNELDDVWADDAPTRRVSVSCPPRQLKTQSSRERSPRRAGQEPPPSTLPADAACGGETLSSADTAALPAASVFSVGCNVVVHGLSSRQQLNGATAVVTAPCSERGRYPVKVDSNGEEVMVQPGNLRASIFESSRAST